jgi:hypothetical protein
MISWKYIRVIREEQETWSVQHGAHADGTISDRGIEVRYIDPGDKMSATIRLTHVE